jgi:hypothetical protein
MKVGRWELRRPVAIPPALTCVAAVHSRGPREVLDEMMKYERTQSFVVL